jgi:DNA-binding response OmpR family regulator
MLPLKDGFSICKEVRSHSVDTPVLMLTAKGEMEDRVKGLTIGADDYLVKPFAFEELLARVRSLLRRPKQSIQLTLQISPDISVNLAAHVVIKDGMEIPLTPKEFSLLEFLIRHKNQAVTQQAIFDHVFDFAKENWSNTVEVHIKNLRKKLFPIANESPLKTVRGVGYRLELQ